jgi:hypothetical protein
MRFGKVDWGVKNSFSRSNTSKKGPHIDECGLFICIITLECDGFKFSV